MGGIGKKEDPEKEQPQCWTSRVGPQPKEEGLSKGEITTSLRCPRLEDQS